MCGQCSRCNLYSDADKDGSYYLYYLLRSFEQKGRVEYEDMPRLFLETCRNKEAYLTQLNRNLGRATMNLEWKNRFLESRDTVMVQFRELAVMLEEFASQMGQAADITEEKEEAVRRIFRLHQIAVDNMLLLEHENRYREAYVTLHALGGRCMTAKEAGCAVWTGSGRKGLVRAAGHPGAYHKAAWSCAVLEAGEYRRCMGLPACQEWKLGFPGIIIPIPGVSRSGDHEPFRWHGKREHSGPGEPGR